MTGSGDDIILEMKGRGDSDMKISICIDAVFGNRNFIESMKAVRKEGVRGFEFWTWWDKDLKALKSAQEELGMESVAFCTKFISLVDASKREAYIQGLKESIEAAEFMGCKTLISQVGNDNGHPREQQHKNIVAGLKECAPFLEKSGITLAIEPLNVNVDHAGYYLSSSLEGFGIIDETGSANVKLLFDIYHQQITEGDIIRNMTGNIEKIGHFHAAGNPGRNELYFGEINYPEVFKAIDATGYNGYVGFEYFPKDEPAKGIKAFL